MLSNLSKLYNVLIPRSMFNDWFGEDNARYQGTLHSDGIKVLSPVLRSVCRLEMKLNNFCGCKRPRMTTINWSILESRKCSKLIFEWHQFCPRGYDSNRCAVNEIRSWPELFFVFGLFFKERNILLIKESQKFQKNV